MGAEWKQGYGFQFWCCRHHAYRADGAGGQFIVVMPDQDVVVAITADHANMQAELDAIWDDLLPAFQSKALPADAATQRHPSFAVKKNSRRRFPPGFRPHRTRHVVLLCPAC